MGLVAMKVMQASVEHLEKHYADLSSKGFFRGLVTYMASGPVCAMVWEGLNAVKTGRVMLVETTPAASLPGTIRGDFAIHVGRNICHGSDAVESANQRLPSGSSPRSSATGPPPRRTGSTSRSILSTFWSLPLTCNRTTLLAQGSDPVL